MDSDGEIAERGKKETTTGSLTLYDIAQDVLSKIWFNLLCAILYLVNMTLAVGVSFLVRAYGE